MKQLKIYGLMAGLLVVAGGVAMGTSALAGHYLNAQDAASNAKLATCQKRGAAHTVVIQNNKATPEHTDGKLCDTLTITNEDNQNRLMAFGPHEHHQPYDGVAERILGQGQSFTVTMNEAGTYYFHDHIGDIVKGRFTVNK